MKSNQLTLYHCVGNGLKRTDAISLSHQETTLHCLREQGLFVLEPTFVSTPYRQVLAIRIRFGNPKLRSEVYELRPNLFCVVTIVETR